MNNNRPINLDLRSLSYPPMAIASILHRISGIFLFLLLPFVLYVLQQSLVSENAFAALIPWLAHPLYKLLLWVFAASLVYHVLAGIRHMVMDLGFGESLVSGRRSAVIVIVLSVIAAVYLGIRIW